MNLRSTSRSGFPPTPALGLLPDRSREPMERRQAEDRKMEAVGRLAGASAHEFNNILTVIRGNASFLLGDVADPEARKDLEEIVEACDRGVAFTSKLLFLTTRAWRKPRTVDLSNLLRNLDLGRWVPDEVVVCTDLPHDPCRVVADPEHLEDAVMGLIHNARDALRGPGFVRLALESIPGETVDGRQSPGWVHLEVADDGVGMDDATASRALEPFFTTKADPPGRGTGLSTAFGVIRQSGGSMRIDTASGWGTSVHVWLPAAPPVQAHPD
jgi:signal transduction histidine kinase